MAIRVRGVRNIGEGLMHLNRHIRRAIVAMGLVVAMVGLVNAEEGVYTTKTIAHLPANYSTTVVATCHGRDKAIFSGAMFSMPEPDGRPMIWSHKVSVSSRIPIEVGNDDDNDRAIVGLQFAVTNAASHGVDFTAYTTCYKGDN
jgi:hypothetical protein